MRYQTFTLIATVFIAFILMPTSRTMAQDDHHHEDQGEGIALHDSQTNESTPDASGHNHATDHGNTSDASEHDHATGHGNSGRGFSIVTFVGKFHPLIVHFPIALLLAATLSELFCMVKSRKEISDITLYCIVLGAMGAMVAAPLGWANASGTHYDAAIASMSVVTLHRWIGVLTTLLAIAATALAFRAKRSQKQSALRLFRGVLIASAVSVSITGHLGATLVFGVDYFSF